VLLSEAQEALLWTHEARRRLRGLDAHMRDTRSREGKHDAYNQASHRDDCTGYCRGLRGRVLLLAKPYRKSDLATMIRKALGA
jgi:hypothetical protein